MPPIPETRASLILRLPRADDAEAWREFVSIYEPFVYGFARRNGFQDADARELVQNVMLAVVKTVGRWQPDPGRARFRTWLFKIARNHFVDQVGKRRAQPMASVGSSVFDAILARTGLTELIAREHRQELFGWAAARVRESVKTQTWRAFWMTTIENESVDAAALALDLSVGAVYVARSRVLARLRQQVKQLESDDAL